MVDFIYTGANNENLNVMTFEGQEIIRLQTTKFHYIRKFIDFAFSQERLSKESFDIINANKNYSKTLSQVEERVRRFKM